MGKGNLRKTYQTRFGRKFPIGNVFSYTVKKGLFLSVYVDDIKLAGKKQNIDPMWESTQQRSSIWENQHLSLIMFSWDALKDNLKSAKILWTIYRTMFESRISAGGNRKLPYSENLRISSWSYDMEGHAKKCVKRYCELGKQADSTTLQSIYSRASMTTTSKKKK